ncbi:hypothetical protein DQD29_19650 [Salmonella enterica subsp. salamae]|nr:hypothetical protein [Salmonella enterica subsp. salamae]
MPGDVAHHFRFLVAKMRTVTGFCSSKPRILERIYAIKEYDNAISFSRQLLVGQRLLSVANRRR